MTAALWVAKTGLDAQQMAIRSISNNLANVNTTGFKRGRPVFESLMYQTVVQPGGESSESTKMPSGLMLGTGVITTASQKIFNQGTVINTESNLDVSIKGRGFLQVQLPDGNTGYTRDGKLQINEQGQLVNAHGYLLQPPITLPQSTNSITIGSDGVVSVTTNDQTQVQTVGNIETADFINNSGLQPTGNNIYRETSASGTPQTGAPGSNGLGDLVQGTLEGSNVNVVEEMVNLIEAQRAYEMNSKAIAAVDHMMQFADEVL